MASTTEWHEYDAWRKNSPVGSDIELSGFNMLMRAHSYRLCTANASKSYSSISSLVGHSFGFVQQIHRF